MCAWGGVRGHRGGECREPGETRVTRATMGLHGAGAREGPPYRDKPDPGGKRRKSTPSSSSCQLPLVNFYSFLQAQPKNPHLWEAELMLAFSWLWQHCLLLSVTVWVPIPMSVPTTHNQTSTD